MKSSTAVTISGVLGLGLVALGGFLYYRERQGASGLGRAKYIRGRFAEAPAIDSYTDGTTTTVLRASENMTIEERIASIQKMVEKSVMDPEMTKLAMKITQNCPERDGKCEAKAIYKWVKKNIRYTGDIAPIKMSDGQTEGIDRYASARKTIEYGGADCDDSVTVIATLASVIGLTTRLRVTKEDPSGDFSHIYPVIGLPKFAPDSWVAVDATLPGSMSFGVEAPGYDKQDFDA